MTNRLYGRRWRQARARYLARHPLCAYCEQQGRLRVATVVDHIRPHRGDLTLFWDESNWQALCATHHNATKQSEEKTGQAKGCGPAGLPLDAGHHWNGD